MRFAHVSDLHLCDSPNGDRALSAHVSVVAEAMARDLARISEVLDFVVVSGDLTEDAHGKSFQQFERLFRPLGLPVFVIPGNHDGPGAYQREARGGFLAECDITGRAVELGEVRLLGLNTCIENNTTGAVADEDLEFIARELATDSPTRPIIVMHHPPFAPGLREFDEIAGLEGAAAFVELLLGAAVPVVVLSGHVHRAYQAHRHGAACFVAGSPAMPFTSDMPFGNSPIRPSGEACHYFVHSLGIEGSHIVMSQPFYPDGTIA